jgi:hypothetical protein
MQRAQDLTLVPTDYARSGHDPGHGAVRVAPICCVVGFPGPLAAWCADMLAAVIGQRHGAPAPIVTAHSLADLGRRLLAASPLPAVALVQAPDAAFCDALTADECRFLLVLSPPDVAVDAIARSRDISVPEAVREAANAQVTTARLVAAPGALAVRPDDAADPDTLAAAIAAHFGLEPPPTAAAAPPSPEPLSAVAALPDWRIAIEEALSGAPAAPLPAATLAQAAMPPRGSQIVWPRDLFCTGEARTPATGAIDVTGPSRCVLYGPYIRLPAGHWSCALLFGCSPEAVGLGMVADVYAGHHLGQVTFTIEEAGIFEIEIAFENPDPDRLVEIRLFTTRAAFEGSIAIGQATLSPLAAKRLKVN